MLTQLFIQGKGFNALQLLALLQQVWPQGTVLEGKGDSTTGFKTPWVPRDASDWFGCAKRVAQYTRSAKFGIPPAIKDEKSQQFWFKIGGRLISIQAGTLYARDCGKFGVQQKGAPSALSKSPDGKDKKIEISYSGLYLHLLDNNPQLDSKTTATALRAIMKGHDAPDNYWPLPLLASVMFISEVARNHTAFHTGLMLLDLIEKGIGVDGSDFQYDLKNSLWSPAMINAIVSRSDTRTITMAKEGGINLIEPGSEASMVAKGMGMGVMSHQLSESGGAFDLEGKGSFLGQTLNSADPDGPMTLTRRKEATLLIRWLSLALKSAHPDLPVGVGSRNIQFEYSKAYELDDYFDPSKLNSMLDRQYVLPLLIRRAASLDCMITETKLS